MRTVFADTFYWISLINTADDWSDRVIQFAESATDIEFVTTDEVLVEVLTFYSKGGSNLRRQASILVRSILSDPTIRVVEQSHRSFLKGLDLYETRMDKGYSLTDCISMNTMRELKLTEALTHDKHFAQEGFVILFDSKK
jgi:predicted nucleic acid-binding protein